jgi:hypothetical protein
MVNDCPKIDKICVEIDVGCFWENRLVLVLILRRVMKTNWFLKENWTSKNQLEYIYIGHT